MCKTHLSTRSPRSTLVFLDILAGAATPAFAFDVALVTGSRQEGYGQWQRFNVSDLDPVSGGSEWIDNSKSLAAGFGMTPSFSSTKRADQVGQFRVVDAGFAGDTFLLFNTGASIGSTVPVVVTAIDTASDLSEHFNATLVNASFSPAVLTLSAGSYQICGRLAQSVQVAGPPLNSTVGAVKLTVSALPVPEPATSQEMLPGLRLRNRSLTAR